MILLFFLAEKGLLEEFVREVTYGYLLDMDFGLSTLLLGSFVWSESVKGHWFWSRINEEYQEFLRSKE